MDEFPYEKGLDVINAESELNLEGDDPVYDMQQPFPDIEEDDEYDEPVTKLLDPNPEKNQTEIIPVSVSFPIPAPTKNFFSFPIDEETWLCHK